jgi:hypothetical protein
MSVAIPAALFPSRSVGPEPAMMTAAGHGPDPVGRVSVPSIDMSPVLKRTTVSRLMVACPSLIRGATSPTVAATRRVVIFIR